MLGYKDRMRAAVKVEHSRTKKTRILRMLTIVYRKILFKALIMQILTAQSTFSGLIL